MSNTKHTPGPWKIRETLSSDGDFVITTDVKKATSYHIAEVLNLNGYVENIANARLIAAAPDLLAACIEFVRKVDNGEAKSTKSYAQMKAAIAKATNP